MKTAESTKLFPTPVGNSYSCQSNTSVDFRVGDVKATMFLRYLKLQPFISKSDFGPGRGFFLLYSKSRYLLEMINVVKGTMEGTRKGGRPSKDGGTNLKTT